MVRLVCALPSGFLLSAPHLASSSHSPSSALLLPTSPPTLSLSVLFPVVFPLRQIHPARGVSLGGDRARIHCFGGPSLAKPRPNCVPPPSARISGASQGPGEIQPRADVSYRLALAHRLLWPRFSMPFAQGHATAATTHRILCPER